MQMRPLTCAQCGADIDREGLDLELGVAMCGACGAIFELGRHDRDDGSPRADDESAYPPERSPEPMPLHFRVEESQDALSVRWRWFGLKYVFTLIFCCFWNGMLFFWFSTVAGIDGVPLLTESLRDEEPCLA